VGRGLSAIRGLSERAQPAGRAALDAHGACSTQPCIPPSGGLGRLRCRQADEDSRPSLELQNTPHRALISARSLDLGNSLSVGGGIGGFQKGNLRTQSQGLHYRTRLPTAARSSVPIRPVLADAYSSSSGFFPANWGVKPEPLFIAPRPHPPDADIGRFPYSLITAGSRSLSSSSSL
jgi:hypothetical protein